LGFVYSSLQVASALNVFLIHSPLEVLTSTDWWAFGFV